LPELQELFVAPQEPSTGIGVGVKPNSANITVVVLRLTVHVPVPEHPPPDQPIKVEPVSDDAERITVIPEGWFVTSNGQAQVDPQFIPAGFEVTVPDPVPALFTTKGASQWQLPEAKLLAY
jgi:hypothetical protein